MAGNKSGFAPSAVGRREAWLPTGLLLAGSEVETATAAETLAAALESHRNSLDRSWLLNALARLGRGLVVAFEAETVIEWRPDAHLGTGGRAGATSRFGAEGLALEHSAFAAETLSRRTCGLLVAPDFGIDDEARSSEMAVGECACAGKLCCSG